MDIVVRTQQGAVRGTISTRSLTEAWRCSWETPLPSNWLRGCMPFWYTSTQRCQLRSSGSGWLTYWNDSEELAMSLKGK